MPHRPVRFPIFAIANAMFTGDLSSLLQLDWRLDVPAFIAMLAALASLGTVLALCWNTGGVMPAHDGRIDEFWAAWRARGGNPATLKLYSKVLHAFAAWSSVDDLDPAVLSSCSSRVGSLSMVSPESAGAAAEIDQPLLQRTACLRYLAGCEWPEWSFRRPGPW